MAIELGTGATVHSSATLMHSDDRTITIGAHAHVTRDVDILGPVTIGNDVYVNRGVYIRPHTVIGARTAIGPFTRIVSDTHSIGPAERRAGPVWWDGITIGSGCWIGASVTILAGVTIGDGAVVAAGAVVPNDVPPNTVVAGVPARVIRELPPGAPDGLPRPGPSQQPRAEADMPRAEVAARLQP